MDDLDRVLLNVEGNAEINEIKESEKESKTVSARKGDKNLGEENYDDLSTESFETIYERLKETQAVQNFKDNHLEGLKPHWNYVIDFKNLLSDMTLPEPVIAGLRKYKYSYLRSIENIESLYDNYLSTKTYDDFEKYVKQEVKLYFPGQETTQQHINFLILKELFLKMREFNSRVGKNWKELGSSLNGMSLVNESSKFLEKAKDIIQAGMRTCSETDMFIEFLASILYIPKKDLDVIEKDIGNRIFFRENFDYDYRVIFKIEKSKKEHEKKHAETEEHSVHNHFMDNEAAEAYDDQTESPEEMGHAHSKDYEELSELMQIPGKSSWNTKEPYLIRIDLENLKKNEEDLTHSIYFVDREMAKEDIDAHVKRAMIRSIGSQYSSIIKEYEEFLFKTVNIQSGIIQETFSSAHYNSDLFLYHCGPATVYHTIKRLFNHSSLGICFKRLSNNKITRFIPDEFIKTSVMRYFKENIFIHDLQFNSIQEFNKIRQHIHNRYKESVAENKKKILIAVEHKFKQTGKKISAEALFYKKIPVLYKPHEIEVYRRFNDRTVFK